MSKIGLGIIAVVILLALLPFALVAKSRASKSPVTAIHIVQDMDSQPKKKAQSPSPMFADGRSMRPEIEGTVAQEDLSLPPELLNDPDHPRFVDDNGQPIAITSPTLYAALEQGRNRPAGMTDEEFNAARPINIKSSTATDKDIAADTFYVKTIPSSIHVTKDLLHRGEERFNIYCAPCHGQSGYGDGPVDAHAEALKDAGNAAGWVKPQDLHDQKIVDRPDGNIFNTITNGVRSMPPYDKQISVKDRWAIIAYVRALQKSQNATDVTITPATAPAAPGAPPTPVAKP